jgi:DNA-binding transcriptional LysR family regulator
LEELIMAPHSPVLELDLLRTLLCIAEEESFTRAAERVGRTQSAVTLQVQKLESLVGRPLLTRSKGGPVSLTPHGKVLVEHAKAMLRLNDEAFAAMASSDMPVSLRMGISAYYAPLYLQRTLDEMRVLHPNVMVEVIRGRSCQFLPKLKQGEFDLVVAEGGVEPPDWPLTEVWRSPLRWITSTAHDTHLRDPLPLSLWPSCPWRAPWMEDCFWRSAALRALGRVGRAHKIVAVSDTLEEQIEAVLQGQAIMVSPDIMLPSGVRPVAEDEGLPRLPDTRLNILKSQNAPQPMTDDISRTILACVEGLS